MTKESPLKDASITDLLKNPEPETWTKDQIKRILQWQRDARERFIKADAAKKAKKAAKEKKFDTVEDYLKSEPISE